MTSYFSEHHLFQYYKSVPKNKKRKEKMAMKPPIWLL